MTQRTKRTKWVQLDLIDLVKYDPSRIAYNRWYSDKGTIRCSDHSDANPSTSPKAHDASETKPERQKPPTLP